MPLDTLVGGATTDSYNSLVEFDAYVLARLFVPTTFVPTTDQKESGLRLATSWIDKLCFLGAATSSTQLRKFPRTGLLTQNGFTLPSNIHPAEIKAATNELAYLMLTSDRTVESVGPLQGLTDLKAGPVSMSFKGDVLKKFQVVPDSVKLLIVQEWLCPKERVVPDESVEPILEML